MTVAFQILAGALAALFLAYGMDVRRKPGARGFVAAPWQVLMKACSFALIGAFVWTIVRVGAAGAVDWVALALMCGGTALVVAAKRALGKAHTFTGHYLERPGLVTHGVYAFTRNPLYLGVFACEIGAAIVLVGHAAEAWPAREVAALAALAGALAYAVVFNLRMASREAAYLEACFGDAYRRYRARVPFLVPFTAAR